MKFYQDISCNFSNISNAAIRGILMSVIHCIWNSALYRDQQQPTSYSTCRHLH